MFIVRSNLAKFEYDIHSLIKAFYPEKEVKILTPGSVVKNMTLLSENPAMRLDFCGGKVVFKTYLPDEHTYEWEYDGSTYDSVDYKNAFKRFLYKALSEETGTTLPWGNLTGIRPTKIAMSMLEQGKDEKEISDLLQKEHFVSGEKINLSIDIAKREKELLQTLHYENGYSLYIGIPFCPTTCLYCSFTSFPIRVWKERVADYLSALEKEMDYAAEAYKNKVLDTIYIGGGTPTSLSAPELERLLTKVKSSFNLSGLQEFTVEAGRADSITGEKLEVLKKYGVTRISVNPQTMKDETLKLIGRQHTVSQVVDAFHIARECGFDNINMDMILGLPNENEEDVMHTIEAVEELAPDSLTVHSLAIKRAAAMQGWVAENGITSLHNTEEMIRIAADGARRMSMFPYYLYRQKNMAGNFENVGYARAGKYGIYNILIMEEKQTIIALGAGTITKKVTRRTMEDGSENVLIRRCDNVKEVAGYIERIDEMIERKRKLLEEA